jgi:hypothetical protein
MNVWMLHKLLPKFLGETTFTSGHGLAHHIADDGNYQLYRCEGLKTRK